MKYTLFLLVLSLLGITGCDLYPQDEYQEEYVVESYLIANQLLPNVRLSKTSTATELYEFSTQAVTDAEVNILLLSGDEGSAIEEVFTYQRNQAGIYSPITGHQVLPTRTYKLEVNIPGFDDQITAHTIIPDTFKVVSEVPSTIVYKAKEQLNITVSRSSYPNRQNIFIFNTISEQPRIENLTPVYADFYETNEDLEDFKNLSSGIINEQNFELNEDGTITIQYPWLAVAFYGRSIIYANTIDDNIYDFVRSQSVQLGGSTLSPGEIQNVIYNIDGGVGVFGSMARDSVQTIILRFDTQ